jgi:hypothetical protein
LWWNGFGLPEVDGWINAVAEFQGQVVIAGRFSQVGGTSARNIAAWDGNQWNNLGSGPNDDVMCLTVYRGELIAGGRFQMMDGVSTLGIAKWDGSRWTSLGGGLHDPFWQNPAVQGLLVTSDALVACGEFSMADTINATHVATWDGSSWAALGNGIPFYGFALGARGDSLFAGGDFDVSDPEHSSGLSVWDGTLWRPVETEPVASGTTGSIRAITTAFGVLFAGGWFDGIAGVPARNVASWNGSDWVPVSSGVPGYVLALAVHEDSLRIGGMFSDPPGYLGGPAVQTWTGSEWIPWDGIFGEAHALLSTDHGLLAGGIITARDDGSALDAVGIARSSPGGWAALGSWPGGMRGVLGLFGTRPNVLSLVVYRDQVLAAGQIAFYGDVTGYIGVNGMAAWDGSRWTAFPWYSAYEPPATLLVEQDTLYAGGFFGYLHCSVLRFDGQEWTAMDTLSLAVTSIARYQGDLYIAGRRASLSHPDVGGVYRWDGSHWQIVGDAAGSEFAGVSALIVYQGRLIAGGDFDEIGGTSARNIAAWDGTEWSPVGPETGGGQGLIGVSALTIHATDLIVSAPYTPGQTSDVLRFDGASWSSVGSIHSVIHVWDAGGWLFAGGWPYESDWQSWPNGVVRWDGVQWRRLGSGTSDIVHALVEHDDHVYMGGWFTRAGGKSSFGMARWDGLSTLRLPLAPAALSTVAPNPFRQTVTLRLTVRNPGEVRVAVHDVHGREIALLLEGTRSPGEYPLVWQGSNRSGTKVASGIYFVDLQGPGGARQSIKIVRLK